MIGPQIVYLIKNQRQLAVWLQSRNRLLIYVRMINNPWTLLFSLQEVWIHSMSTSIGNESRNFPKTGPRARFGWIRCCKALLPGFSSRYCRNFQVILEIAANYSSSKSNMIKQDEMQMLAFGQTEILYRHTCFLNKSCQNSLQMNLMTSKSCVNKGLLIVYLSTSCRPTLKPGQPRSRFKSCA